MKMLVSVVENGYGKLAKVDGYSNETWQSFVGFAPAYDPKFVVLVRLDNPTKTKTSEYSATPMFHDLAQYILDY